MPQIVGFSVLGKTYSSDYNGLCEALSEANYDQRSSVSAVYKDGRTEEITFDLALDASWEQISEVGAELSFQLEELGKL